MQQKSTILWTHSDVQVSSERIQLLDRTNSPWQHPTRKICKSTILEGWPQQRSNAINRIVIILFMKNLRLARNKLRLQSLILDILTFTSWEGRLSYFQSVCSLLTWINRDHSGSAEQGSFQTENIRRRLSNVNISYEKNYEQRKFLL